jgi:hypothetical protein
MFVPLDEVVLAFYYISKHSSSKTVSLLFSERNVIFQNDLKCSMFVS